MKRFCHLLLLGALSLSVACASSGAAVGDRPLSGGSQHDYVATRAFAVHSTPSIGGDTVQRFRTGDGFSGRVSPVDDVWTYLWLHGGAQGYVFGQPYRRAAGEGR